MVFRIYVEKKQGLAFEAAATLRELQALPKVSNLVGLRLLNRYDVEGIDLPLFERACRAVFSEPQTDDLLAELPADSGFVPLAVEFLPGQFDQRADSAAQCIQLLSGGQRPNLRSARIYLLQGQLSAAELQAIREYLINPVESREAELAPYQSLEQSFETPADVPVLQGFIQLEDAELAGFIKQYSLAMDEADLAFCRDYFQTEQRNPTLTELRVLDTYWSDHCRHTTFSTTLTDIQIEDAEIAATFARYQQVREQLQRTSPVNLMDMATLATRWLRQNGQLARLDESDEINACTVKITVQVDGQPEQWLLLFKNETHNHPTEIEPFGGAATCLGGAIRDPLSGRAYVYQAMRITGAADPLVPLEQTLPGKLPQRRITTSAAAGYSSYGNQIGLATGLVDEIYHPGYAAKRMEIGAVVGAARQDAVRREKPLAGDVILLLGGGTGRDGIGGATGSSKAHDKTSIETCGAEVQKGNAPEERKIQRLFRNSEAARLIKKCNDFGAGGVSVAIGELADGLTIDLDAVPKKYEGLDGTELAISESQERMAVVVEKKDAARFIELAAAENLLCVQVAVVEAEPRLRMQWRGKYVVDISRKFLDSNGAEKHAKVRIAAPAARKAGRKPWQDKQGFAQKYLALAADLNICGKRGLVERFDSTVGANTLLLPFGGKHQLSPTQVMAAKIPLLKGETNTCSVMGWGFDPFLSEQSPYHGAYTAVLQSVAKLVAAGAPLADCYLSFQEYFPKLGTDATRWGLPTAALLGAFAAQLDLGLASIGGKDSMSGSFEQLDVPPTLVSFAITVADGRKLLSPEFKQVGSRVVYLSAACGENGLPTAEAVKALFAEVQQLADAGHLLAAYVPTFGGVAAAVLKMSLGNNIGCTFAADLADELLFGENALGFVLELSADAPACGVAVGQTTAQAELAFAAESLALAELLDVYEGKLASVFPTAPTQPQQKSLPPLLSYQATSWPRLNLGVQPHFLVPVFPGTNCEYETCRAIEAAGGKAETLIIANLSPQAVADSVRRLADGINRAQAIVLPGGFSAGDEPDGSGKFITAVFRNPQVSDAVAALLQQRKGLISGICNGFQALIKLGLLPYGEIRDMDADCPTLTYNVISRHQSRVVDIRISSNKSPWLAKTAVGDIFSQPISHGEGRFLCPTALLDELAQNGQIATQYVDKQGQPSLDISANPNGSLWAVEGICSPDGRVLGKMGHAERIGSGLYRNVPGNYDIHMFEAAVEYFG